MIIRDFSNFKLGELNSFIKDWEERHIEVNGECFCHDLSCFVTYVVAKKYQRFKLEKKERKVKEVLNFECLRFYMRRDDVLAQEIEGQLKGVKIGDLLKLMNEIDELSPIYKVEEIYYKDNEEFEASVVFVKV